jgi:hypothetical protein
MGPSVVGRDWSPVSSNKAKARPSCLCARQDAQAHNLFRFIEVVRNRALLRPSLKGMHVRPYIERHRHGGVVIGISRADRDLPSSVGNSLTQVASQSEGKGPEFGWACTPVLRWFSG